jgi:hypothetical protein
MGKKEGKMTGAVNLEWFNSEIKFGIFGGMGRIQNSACQHSV